MIKPPYPRDRLEAGPQKPARPAGFHDLLDAAQRLIPLSVA